jgi:tol-pal system protein YbgF
MIKSILTTIAVTTTCAMMACAPAGNTRSDLSLIQNQLDESNEKLEQLSQQMALIQMRVDTHQRTLQDLKSADDAGTESEIPQAEFTDAPAPPATAPAPQATLDLPEDSGVAPPTALHDSSTPEVTVEVPQPSASVPLEKAAPSPQAPPVAQGNKNIQASPEDRQTTTDAPNPLYQKAMEVFRGGDYESAAVLFEDFVKKFPQDDLADNALYWAGECRYTKKKFSEAIQHFKRVVEEYPAGSKVPDALLKIGFAHISLGDMASAETYLKRVIAQYPFSSAGTKAEERLRTLRKD